jgi:hypothetical protein
MYDGQAPDLCQFVPPSRIRREFTKVLDREATFYLLVNVGRVREQLPGTAAVMAVGRDAGPWTDPDHNEAEAFWDRWCARYFGEAASAARACYDALYEAPFKWGEWTGCTDYSAGDFGYYRRARTLVSEALSAVTRRQFESRPNKHWGNRVLPMAAQAEHYREQAGPAMPKLEAARAQALDVFERLTGSGADFFEANVLAQIEIHLHSNRYLLDMIDAVMAYEEGHIGGAEQKVRAALESMGAVRAAMTRMERDKWAGWNRTNYWAGVEIGESTAQTFLTVVYEFQLQRRG